MYKYLIIGIAFMFVASGGYYINKSGGIGLLFGALTAEESGSMVRLQANDISGLYMCDTTSGCVSKYILLLRDDMSSKMIALEENHIDNDSSSTESNGTQTSEVIETSSSTEGVDIIDTTVQTEGIIGQNQNETVENGIVSDTTLPTDEEIESFLSEETLVDETPSNIYKGTWDIAVQNMLVITLTSQGTTTYDVPQKIVVKNVSPNSLSKISFTKTYYPDMITPVFIRQE